MRECIISTLVLLFLPAAFAQNTPAGWKLVRDAKNACQIAVPAEWSPLSENGGAAVLHDPDTALAVVTTQPGQEFKPLTPSMTKILDIRKDKLFENTAKRIFYEDKSSTRAEDPSAYSASVPGNNGVCSCRVVFLPSVGAETARKIALSLGPAPETASKLVPPAGH